MADREACSDVPRHGERRAHVVGERVDARDRRTVVEHPDSVIAGDHELWIALERYGSDELTGRRVETDERVTAEDHGAIGRRLGPAAGEQNCQSGGERDQEQCRNDCRRPIRAPPRLGGGERCARRLAELAAARVALTRILRERLRDDSVDLSRQLWSESPDGGRLLLDVCGQGREEPRIARKSSPFASPAS
jgi:hypothetical protein